MSYGKTGSPSDSSSNGISPVPLHEKELTVPSPVDSAERKALFKLVVRDKKMSPKVKSDHLFELLLSPYCEQVDHATEIEKGADYYLSFYRQKYGVTPGRIEVNSTMKEGGPDHVEKQLFTTDF